MTNDQRPMTNDYALRFGFDQRQFAVGAPIEHADRGRLEIAEDDQTIVSRVDRALRVGERHRPERLPRLAQDARHPHALAPRPRRLDCDRLALFADKADALAAAAALALLPLAFDLVGLLRDLVDRHAQRRLP